MCIFIFLAIDNRYIKSTTCRLSHQTSIKAMICFAAPSEFCSQHTTFKKLDKKLIDFVKHKVISLLKEYAPDENSLGLRVMHIIESDLFKKRTVTLNSKEQNTAITRLISVSASYIEELEQLQEEYMSIHGTTI